MSYSSALKWFVAISLPLTLAWKLSVKVDNADYLENNLLAFLMHQDFAAVATGEMMDSFPIIVAKRGACQMRVMKASYYGADRDTIKSLVAAPDRLLFVYRGSVYAEQPVWLIVADQFWMRSLRSLGLADHEPPVLAVAAAAPCEADRLPWAQLK